MKLTLLVRVLASTTILWFLTAACLVDKTFASVLGDQLSGKSSHNFTLVYNVKTYNKLAMLPAGQIKRDVDRWYNSTQRSAGGQASTSAKQNLIEELNIEAESGPGDNYLNMTISVSGNKLLVKEYWPQRHEIKTFLYDGEHTLQSIKGADAQIFPRFQYTFLRNFVFPGFSVATIPLVKDFSLLSASAQNKSYTGMVAASDGAAEVGGLPQYRTGVIKTQVTDGNEYVVETHAGSIEKLASLHINHSLTAARQPEQECYYSNYHVVGNKFLVPANIKLVESWSPAGILPFGPYYRLEYILQKASSVALPPKQFRIESQIPRGTIVYNNVKKGTSAIQFVPGKDLEQQFKDNDKLQESRRLLHAHDTGRSNNVGFFILLTLIAALCGWFFYKRSLMIK